jgi:condensin complex subunit 2
MISGRTKRHVIANKSVQDEALLDEQGDFWNDAQSMADDHSLDPADIPLPPSDAEEDDDGGHNILEAVEAEDIEYGNQLISQGGRRVKPIFMNYAKVAKRVDVRKLKENIWTNLENDEPEQRFTEVMDGLHAVYPEQKMNDISVSFCFICLLHLANEKNLEISSTSTLDELVVKRHV